MGASVTLRQETLYLIPVLVCGMESYHLYTEGLFPSDVCLDTAIHGEGFLLWEYV